ncbi:hypothetical protein [Rhizobium jaguaris]|uniref:Nucleoside 2-deoxyribosyltransferase n=1 Tax=Rhizobium jaguaris TaxID=1312183 RepID=A0A387FKT1_9HYPH|nr:hypothetical protein [Rhizobium jaguaris]AYG60010.1 hypothetical protein CCGE525_15220 [Rhizobium jaguaris]
MKPTGDDEKDGAAAKRKTCFVVGPIGAADSETRRRADWLLRGIIQPVFDAHFPGYDVVRSDTIVTPGMIDVQMINHLHDAELVIADMSETNPNAFYEMGIRHMTAKPIVHMYSADTKIPFDVAPHRAIPFSIDHVETVDKARRDLKDAVAEAVRPNFKVINPVTRARGVQQIENAAPPELQLLWEEITELRRQIGSVASAVGPLEGANPHGYRTYGGVGYATPVPSTTGTLTFSKDISDHQFNVGHSAAQLAFREHLVGSGISERTYQFTLQLPIEKDPQDYVLTRVGHYDDIERIEVNGREVSKRLTR